jgi:uncharacterized protein (DUF486 family)
MTWLPPAITPIVLPADLKRLHDVCLVRAPEIHRPAVLYLGEPITLNHAVGFALICTGAFFVFKGSLFS